MIKREEGFTLVELLITMVVFVLAIAAVSQIFTGLLTQFKQQSKIIETNIEGIIGLEILRQDIASAGYGLPWNITGVTDTDGDGNIWEHLSNYSEAASASSPNPAGFNDATKDIDGDGDVGEAPRMIVSGDNVTFSGSNSVFNGSDYLVIKSISVAGNDTCKKWTTLKVGDVKKTWDIPSENLTSADRVLVVTPGATQTNTKSLILSGGFYTRYDNTSGFAPSNNPETRSETRIVYGIDPATNPRMPFNRADYFITRNRMSGENLTPSRCASNTGVLVKAIVSHDDGDFDLPLDDGDDGITDEMPLLDCVADMQVIYRFDMNQDGKIGTASNADGSTIIADNSGNDGATVATVQDALDRAASIRNVLKEIRVYILAHEGQKDLRYTYPSSTIDVGDDGLGRVFNLATKIGDPEYKYYRWKLYTIVVSPNNLR